MDAPLLGAANSRRSVEIPGDDVAASAPPADDDRAGPLPASQFEISLTDYQIVKALQLSESGTWLLSTVTIAVARLEAKQLVKRHSHPSDRRATPVTITEEGRDLADAATNALGRMEFGPPGLSTSQARSLTATLTRLRACVGDVDRSYGSAPNDLG